MFMRSPEPDFGNGPQRSVEIYLEVDDVRAYHEQVTARGKKAADPLTDQWWGGRTFVVQVPNHCRVWYHTNVAAAHEEGLRRDAGEEQSHDRRAG